MAESEGSFDLNACERGEYIADRNSRLSFWFLIREGDRV